MIEYLEVSFDSREPKAARFKRWVQDLEARGYKVDVKFGIGTWHRFLAPIGDDSWTGELKKAIAAGLIDEDWHADRYEQVYSEEDVRTALFFSLVNFGHDIDIPIGRDQVTGFCHFTDVDLSALCGSCNAGGMQGGPLRLRGSELNRCGQVADIMIDANAFYLLVERLAETLMTECSCELPLLEVETYGRLRARERWFQLVPKFDLPAEAICPVHQGPVVRCPQCDAVRTGPRPGHFGAYFALWGKEMGNLEAPPVVRCPFIEGELSRLPDGRVVSYPDRALWLRGDVGRELARRNIRGLSLTPIVFSSGTNA